MDSPPSARPAMCEDLQRAIEDIKSSMASQYPPMSYAAAAKGPASQNRLTPPRPTISPEAQEKEVFISMKNTSKYPPLLHHSPLELTKKCNLLLSTFFRDPENGGIDMPSALRSTSRLPNGNVVLSFRTKDDADRARVHVDDWLKLIDPATTIPRRTYAVVTHNAPAVIWTDPNNVAAAIREIEDTNRDIAAFEFDIVNLIWLNSQDAHDKSGRSPLMISFKSKVSANASIDQNLAMRGITCSVSIYIPRPPQCFWCQVWGHWATECSAREN